MKKLIVPLGNALGLLVSGGVIIKYLYILLISPFITKELISMTWLGLFILVLAIGTLVSNYNYFKKIFKKM